MRELSLRGLGEELQALVHGTRSTSPDEPNGSNGPVGTFARLMKRLAMVQEGPLTYATVVRVLAPSEGQQPVIGTEVRVKQSQRYPEAVGLIGYAITDQPSDHRFTVVFANDRVADFLFSTDESTELEIIRPTETAIVAVDGRLIEVLVPDQLSLTPGQGVMLSSTTMQIVKAAATQLSGAIVSVKRCLPDGRAEIDFNGQAQVVTIATGVTAIEAGHQVCLDPSNHVIIENLGFDDGRFAPKKFKPVTWDQVGGYADLKLELQEMLEETFDPAIAATIDESERVRGILFHGPGGTGKTYLVRALYTAMLMYYEQRQITEAGFFNIEAAELLEGIVGATEKLMRRTVSRALDFTKRNGVPAVILLNEVDAIAKKRGTGVSTDVNDSNVPMLLGLMDGFEKNDIIWVFVTNRLDVLDPELIRDGRIDRMFFVGRADQVAASEIFRIHLSTKPLGDQNLDTLVTGAVAALYDPTKALYELTFKDSDEHRSFTLGHLACGALIENAVKQAAKLARRRHKQAGTTGPVTLELIDLQGAIETIYRAKQSVNILNDVNAFLGEDAERLQGAKRRLRQVQA